MPPGTPTARCRNVRTAMRSSTRFRGMLIGYGCTEATWGTHRDRLTSLGKRGLLNLWTLTLGMQGPYGEVRITGGFDRQGGSGTCTSKVRAVIGFIQGVLPVTIHATRPRCHHTTAAPYRRPIYSTPASLRTSLERIIHVPYKLRPNGGP